MNEMKIMATIKANMEEITRLGIEAYKHSYSSMSGWNNIVSAHIDGTVSSSYLSDNSFSSESFAGNEMVIVSFGKREIEDNCFTWAYIQENISDTDIEKFENYLVEEFKNDYENRKQVLENEKTFENFKKYDSETVDALHEEALDFEVREYADAEVEQQIDIKLATLEEIESCRTIDQFTDEEINERFVDRSWGDLSGHEQEHFRRMAIVVEADGEGKSIIDFHNLDISIAGAVEYGMNEQIVLIDNDSVFYNPIV